MTTISETFDFILYAFNKIGIRNRNELNYGTLAVWFSFLHSTIKSDC